jgi:general secretion pathway protein G
MKVRETPLRSALRSSAGFSFVELVIATAVMMVLASAALPLARVSIKRQKEVELHADLRLMRKAIDDYKDAVTSGKIGGISVTGTDGYPPDLQTLVTGVVRANSATSAKIKFLRRVPIDPMTGSAEWGLRASGDAPDAKSWGGSNVYDVYSTSDGKALDGTKYKDW